MTTGPTATAGQGTGPTTAGHATAVGHGGESPGGPSSDTPTRKVWPAVLGGVALLAVAGTIVAFTLGGGAPDPQPTTASPTASPVDPVEALVPSPTDLVGVLDGETATFTWTNPEPLEGDSYLWRTVTVLETGELERLAEPTVEVPAPGGAQVCIEVSLRRAEGRTSPTVRGCTP